MLDTSSLCINVLHRTLDNDDACTPTWDCVCPDYGLSTGGLCPAGHYCPQGSPAPIECDGGSYCASNGLATPTGTSHTPTSLLLVYALPVSQSTFSSHSSVYKSNVY